MGLTNPLRQRFRAWAHRRLAPADTLQLTQRNIYILPTRAGWLFALTLVVLLLASINYQLNLGYVLTFLLAGCGLVSMHLTHNVLRGLSMHLRPVAPGFAGEAASLQIALTADSRARYGLGLKLESAASSALAWVDVAEGTSSDVTLGFVEPSRGARTAPLLSVETRFPLGLFRAWSIWRPASSLLIYPAPERPAAPLPLAASAQSGDAPRALLVDGGETDGVRAYRRGDQLNWLVWKKAARAMETGGELVSRDTRSAIRRELWLDWNQCAGLDAEQKLSRICAWTLAADKAGLDYGLRLPGRELQPAHGDAHRHRILETLATWQ